MYVVVRKLQALQGPLKQLHIHKYGKIIEQVDEAREALVRIQERLQHDHDNKNMHTQEIKAREQFLIKSKSAQAYMIQHSKATWIKEEDDNTSYFHGLMKRISY